MYIRIYTNTRASFDRSRKGVSPLIPRFKGFHGLCDVKRPNAPRRVASRRLAGFKIILSRAFLCRSYVRACFIAREKTADRFTGGRASLMGSLLTLNAVFMLTKIHLLPPLMARSRALCILFHFHENLRASIDPSVLT